MVKLFPATNLGMSYVKEVLLPLPEIRLCPTGGVNLSNARDWLEIGAAALGVGTSLLPREMVIGGDFAGITKMAMQWAELTAPQTTGTGA